MTRFGLITAMLCSTALLQAERIAIVGGMVVDGTGAAPVIRTVLVNDRGIEAVGANLSVPPGARVIDAKGLTLIPGLFGVHTHLLASAGRVHADWGKNLNPIC